MQNNLTLVTALFDIGRENIDKGFSRSFQHYLDTFSQLLKIDLPMVIFCDAQVEEFVLKHRSPANTRFVRKTVDDLRKFPFYDQVQNIRKDGEWLNRSGWISGSPQASLELYNPLVMSKHFFLHDASIFDFFQTKHFAWIDAGLANTVSLQNYFDSDFVQKLVRRMNKMLYVAFPYDGNVEVHGFEKSALNQWAGKNTDYVVRGGFFGGTKQQISQINEIYYTLLNDTLHSGLMGTEESVFTILTYRHPELVNVNMIESNGLVYKFFEDVKSDTLDVHEHGDGTTAIYVLTYNLPKQFQLWAESFKAAYPKEFNTFKKYVINNSNDASVADAYAKLFSDYNFVEMKYDNIGINDGRFEAAKHFDASSHEFMIFFEDDMLLHPPTNNKSKLGLCTHYDSIFETCADIIKTEGLDYLKLSFDEFYGNNTENWGIVNLPKDKRQQYYPDNNRKTKIDYLGAYKGVPYAVGSFHYCNWPILFTKRGNKKVFFETPLHHKFEQTWMSMVCEMQLFGKIRAGSILASIINHSRVYHYPKEKRRENKFYN